MGYNNHGIQWSDELIKTEIYKVMNALNITRMPSNKEMYMVNKNLCLGNAVCKRGGFYKWAQILGLEVKNCETKTGKGFEYIAARMLIEKGYRVRKMSVKHPYDLLINGCIRIDVKSGRPYLLKGSRVHTFGINKEFATCDLYFILALNESDKPEKTFIIPGCDLQAYSLSIGEKSKYNVYVDRWDLIEQYKLFYTNIASTF